MNHSGTLQEPTLLTNTTPLDKYLILDRLGGGAFGDIYRGLDTVTKEQLALKYETREIGRYSPLQREYAVYLKMQGEEGFPRVHNFIDMKTQKVMAISLLGLDLMELFKMCHEKFSLKTVLMIADQAILRLEKLHSKGYLHRDMKPENFLIGPNPRKPHSTIAGSMNISETTELPTILYLLDFGLSKEYRTETGEHIPYKEKQGIAGTARYMSRSANQGNEQGRRDDLESLGYMLVYFMKGSLPWQSIRVSDRRERYRKISAMKYKISFDELCKDLPKEFLEYFQYCQSLGFDETPNYLHLRKLFRTLYLKLGYQDNGKWDWNHYLKPRGTYRRIPDSKATPENLEENASDSSIRFEELRRIPVRHVNSINRKKSMSQDFDGKSAISCPVSAVKKLALNTKTSRQIEQRHPTQGHDKPQVVGVYLKYPQREDKTIISDNSSRGIYFPRSFISNGTSTVRHNEPTTKTKLNQLRSGGDQQSHNGGQVRLFDVDLELSHEDCEAGDDEFQRGPDLSFKMIALHFDQVIVYAS